MKFQKVKNFSSGANLLLFFSLGPPENPGVPTPTQVSSTHVGISWTAPENDGGSPVTSYSVEMQADGGDWTTVSNSLCL